MESAPTDARGKKKAPKQKTVSRGGPEREPIPNDKLPPLIHVIYNVWFKKWKGHTGKMSEKEWEDAINEAFRIMDQGQRWPIVRHLVIAFLYELEARSEGGYSETTKDKLLAIIGNQSVNG